MSSAEGRSSFVKQLDCLCPWSTSITVGAVGRGEEAAKALPSRVAIDQASATEIIRSDQSQTASAHNAVQYQMTAP